MGTSDAVPTAVTATVETRQRLCVALQLVEPVTDGDFSDARVMLHSTPSASAQFQARNAITPCKRPRASVALVALTASQVPASSPTASAHVQRPRTRGWRLERVLLAPWDFVSGGGWKDRQVDQCRVESLRSDSIAASMVGPLGWRRRGSVGVHRPSDIGRIQHRPRLSANSPKAFGRSVIGLDSLDARRRILL